MKSYVLLPTVIGETAPITRLHADHAHKRVRRGHRLAVERLRLAPDGLAASVTFTFRGWTSLNVVAVSPAESGTVRWTRYQTVDSV